MQDSTGNSTSPGVVSVPAHKRDWTQGSITRNLFSLSWPMIVSNSLNILGPAVDMIWVGKLGSDSIAAVGVAGTVVMLVSALLVGVFTGLRSMVARYIGERDNERAIHVVRQALVTSAAFAFILAVIGIFLAGPMLSLMGLEPDIVRLGENYLRIQFVGMAAITFRMLTDGSMQAAGDTHTPMRLAVIFRFVHLVLCPFMVFGWWWFPRLGIEGAAITGVLSQSLGTILGMWILMSGRSRLRLTFSGFRIDFYVIRQLLKIGIPASIMMLQMQLGQVILMGVVVPFGNLAVAAFSLCLRIDMIIIMPLLGLGMSAGVLVGQNLGARQPQRAEKSGWIALGLSQVIMVGVSLILLVWAEGVVRVFNSEPEMVEVTSMFIRISVVAYLMISFMAVLQQCISGAGDTVPPMIISFVSIWVLQIPLALILPHVGGLGVYGIRWAMVASAALGMIAYTLYFKSGRWKRKKL